MPRIRTLNRIMVSRTDGRTVPCPFCRVDAGGPCIGKRGRVREANHMERVNAFLAASGHLPKVSP